MDGIYLVNKPASMTSFDVVYKIFLKKLPGQSKIHIRKSHFDVDSDDFKRFGIQALTELPVQMQTVQKKHGILPAGNTDGNAVMIVDQAIVPVCLSDAAQQFFHCVHGFLLLFLPIIAQRMKMEEGKLDRRGFTLHSPRRLVIMIHGIWSEKHGRNIPGEQTGIDDVL